MSCFETQQYACRQEIRRAPRIDNRVRSRKRQLEIRFFILVQNTAEGSSRTTNTSVRSQSWFITPKKQRGVYLSNKIDATNREKNLL